MPTHSTHPPPLRCARRLAATAIAGLALVAAACSAPASEGGESAQPSHFRLGTQLHELQDQVAFAAERIGPLGLDETMTVVILSTEAIDREAVSAALSENGDWSPWETHLELRFRDTGKLHQISFQAEGTQILHPGFDLESDVTLRPEGPAGVVRSNEPIANFDDEFELIAHIDTPLIEL